VSPKQNYSWNRSIIGKVTAVASFHLGTWAWNLDFLYGILKTFIRGIIPHLNCFSKSIGSLVNQVWSLGQFSPFSSYLRPCSHSALQSLAQSHFFEPSHRMAVDWPGFLETLYIFSSSSYRLGLNLGNYFRNQFRQSNFANKCNLLPIQKRYHYIYNKITTITSNFKMKFQSLPFFTYSVTDNQLYIRFSLVAIS